MHILHYSTFYLPTHLFPILLLTGTRRRLGEQIHRTKCKQLCGRGSNLLLPQDVAQNQLLLL